MLLSVEAKSSIFHRSTVYFNLCLVLSEKQDEFTIRWWALFRIIPFTGMNLDELLAFKPQKKRSLAEDDVREDEKPPSSKRRGILAGNGTVSHSSSGMNRGADRDGPIPLVGLSGGASGGGMGMEELNGVSEEEKLRILQSLEDDEDDTG